MGRSVVTVAALALSAAALGACSSGGAQSSPSPVPTASVVAVSATDIAFAQSMIPHHEQAVEMADMALAADSGSSAQVQELAEQIKGAQGPEIQQMAQWLTTWGAPTAMPGATDTSQLEGMDHSGHDMGGLTMSGMMTAEQMQDLQQARGQEFDQMWLEMMIEHHEGAIEMAEQVQTSSDPGVAAMADAIVTGQEAEIRTMQALLTAGQ